MRLGGFGLRIMGHTIGRGQLPDIRYQLFSVGYGFFGLFNIVIWTVSVHVTFLSSKERGSVSPHGKRLVRWTHSNKCSLA